MKLQDLPKFIRINTLRYQPPGNPNRDDQGNPKQTTVGSTNRGRVSSQCRNYWIRQSELFQQRLLDMGLGVRTQDAGRVIYDSLMGGTDKFDVPGSETFDEKRAIMMGYLAARYLEADSPTKTEYKRLASHSKQLAEELQDVRQGNERDEYDAFVVGSWKKKPWKFDEETQPKDKLSALLKTSASAFYHHHELQRAVGASATALMEHFGDYPSTGSEMAETKDDVMNVIESIYEDIEPSPDVALFGRMMAKAVEHKVHSPVFPAHDITTNEVKIGLDTFTATDDWRDIGSKDDSGSDHLNTKAMLQGVFYGCSVVDVHKLCENLGGDAEKTQKVLRAFVEAYCLVAPEAQRTSFGYNSEPFYVRLEKTDLNPKTYHLALLEPVEGGDIARKSVERIERHAEFYEKKTVSDDDEFDTAVWCVLPDIEESEDVGELVDHRDDLWSFVG